MAAALPAELQRALMTLAQRGANVPDPGSELVRLLMENRDAPPAGDSKLPGMVAQYQSNAMNPMQGYDLEALRQAQSGLNTGIPGIVRGAQKRDFDRRQDQKAADFERYGRTLSLIDRIAMQLPDPNTPEGVQEILPMIIGSTWGGGAVAKVLDHPIDAMRYALNPRQAAGTLYAGAPVRAAGRGAEAVRSGIENLGRGNARLRLAPEAGNLYARTAPDLDAQPWRARVEPLENTRRIRGGDSAGQYVGAPSGINTPEKLDALANGYADRIEYALENGAYPGYFYSDAGEVMRTLSGGDPRVAEKVYGSSAVVSAGNRVVNERGMSGRALEQWDMGLGRPDTPPIYAGQYRSQDRTMERMFQGIDEGRPATDFVQGQKIEEYGAAASGKLDALGANDRWEMYSVFGGTPDKMASPTEAQNAFLHSLRQRAADIIEARHGFRLRPKEAQELNWAVAKAMGENKAVADVVSQETWSGALPRQTTLQTWETFPGPKSREAGHMPGATPKDKGPIHAQLRTALVADDGRDRLMGALGSSQQLPVVDGPGVYKGVVSPGVTSRGIGSAPYGEVHPVTQARVRAQETTRAYLLGQDTAAASMLQAGSPISAMQINAPLTPQAAKTLERRLSEVYGAGKVGLINTGDGFAIINHGGAKNFSQQFAKYLDADVKKMFGTDITVDKRALVKGPDGGVLYADIPWKGKGKSPATTFLLQALDNPDIPAMRQLADSPEMRAVVGLVADAYDQLSGLLPRDQLVTVLRAWEERGLPAVREMVKKGTAPAIVVGVLSGVEERAPVPGDS